MKILVVFTGGTIGSVRKGDVISLNEEYAYTLLDMYSKECNDVEFLTVCPYNILSEDLCGDNLNCLYECISSYKIDDFDGIILTHGTDTLQYTSAFLSYTFNDIKKPMVIVSANYPLEDSRSNGLANFRSAVDFIRSSDAYGVFVAYRNNGENTKIHMADRLLAHSAYSDDVHSIYNSFFGEIIEGRFIKNEACNKSVFKPQIITPVKLSEKSGVLWIKAYVSMNFPKICRDIKAVLLEGYHSGTLNTQNDELKNFCRQAEEMNIPVYLTGAEKGFFYESKLLFDELKIKILPPMAPISAYMYLWMTHN